MANEYILKDKALNLIEHNDRVCHYADERYENVVYATTQTICKVVADMEAADVQPIRHGRWIDHEKFERKNCNVCIECSVCNTWFGHDCIPKTMFCPNCGARMDLKDGEQND